MIAGVPTKPSKPLPPPALADPLRMDLTVEEGENAWAIRRAIEAIPEIDNLSDFMYCQLAIIVEDDVEDAVRRARELQEFRHKFGVFNTEEDGRRCLRKMIEILPEFVLALEFQNDSYSKFLNVKGFDANLMPTPEKENAVIVGYYYLRHCCTVDFETIRQGIFVHLECSGYDFSKHANIKFFRKFWNAFLKAYPFRFAAKMYNAGALFRAANATAKKFYNKDIVDDFHIESPIPLDQIYLQPNVKIANTRLLLALENALKRRYQMEEEFSLESYSAGLQHGGDGDDEC